MIDTMLSRSGRTDPAGKLTQRLDVPCTVELEEAVTTLATLAGMSKAEYARRVLERAMFGELPMVRRLSGMAASSQWDESPIGSRA